VVADEDKFAFFFRGRPFRPHLKLGQSARHAVGQGAQARLLAGERTPNAPGPRDAVAHEEPGHGPEGGHLREDDAGLKFTLNDLEAHHTPGNHEHPDGPGKRPLRRRGEVHLPLGRPREVPSRDRHHQGQ
jgi:hypothetical protein